MSDIFDQPSALPIPDELTVLRERAKVLGIKISGNIGVDSLRQKIEDHLAGNASKDNDSKEEPDENEDEEENTDNDDVAFSSEAKNEEEEENEPKAEKEVAPKKETLAQKVKRLRLEHLKLIRVRVTCMNPAKKDSSGEFITVANKYIGKVSKFVPFGLEEPYHIPKVIYDELKARRFTNVKTTRKNGVDVVDPEAMRNVPEFAIEVLDPLTEKELNNLRIQQARSNSVD